jgi:hypothetical protein
MSASRQSRSNDFRDSLLRLRLPTSYKKREGPLPDIYRATMARCTDDQLQILFRRVREANRLKPALLIIDVLIDFLEPWPETDRGSLIDAIRSLAHVFRDAGYRVRQEFAPDEANVFALHGGKDRFCRSAA